MASRVPAYIRTTAKAASAIRRVPITNAAQNASLKLRPIHIPTETPGPLAPRPAWGAGTDLPQTVPVAGAAEDVVGLGGAVAGHQQPQQRALDRLPNKDLLRSIAIQSAMSRPFLMDIASNLLKSNLKLITGNPVLSYLLDKVFYAQFCAGRNEAEVRQTVAGLKAMGYRGAILSYAKEVDTHHGSDQTGSPAEMEALHRTQVAQWLDGTLKTIQYSNSGDLVAIKYSGAGQGAVQLLEQGADVDPILGDALEQICARAKESNVRVCVDAEHYSQKKSIDAWTMDLMRRYNKDGETVIYNTYQMYLKDSPATLAMHLQRAKDEGFTLGVKLVRGAYINSDPRHVIFDTKEQTDNAFDEAARMLATQHIDDHSAPKISLVLASHNKESTSKIRALRQEQIRHGLPLADVIYSQLMGMADELSMSITQSTSDVDEDAQVYKYVVWGSTEECVMYLLRRAEENRDAIERSNASQTALWHELRSRLAL
ncbi:proline dehydrogenase [Microsporum ferrugineum]